MTIKEIEVLDKLVNAHNAFIELPIIHECDQIDWVFHIHALQSILMSRDAVKNHPELFKNEHP